MFSISRVFQNKATRFGHLWGTLRLICHEQHINLRAVENSNIHPISRPNEPIATTIPILADLVAPVAAKIAVRINTTVCIARFEASLIVAIYMNVPTTAMNESQKSKNCNTRKDSMHQVPTSHEWYKALEIPLDV